MHQWVHSSSNIPNSIIWTHHEATQAIWYPQLRDKRHNFFSGNIRFQNQGCKTYSFAVTRRTTLNQQLHVCKKLSGNQARSTHQLHAFCSPAFVLIQTVLVRCPCPFSIAQTQKRVQFLECNFSCQILAKNGSCKMSVWISTAQACGIFRVNSRVELLF